MWRRFANNSKKSSINNHRQFVFKPFFVILSLERKFLTRSASQLTKFRICFVRRRVFVYKCWIRRRVGMFSLRAKFVILLIVYFAGFATAIYMLAPTAQPAVGGEQTASVAGGFDQGQFVQSLNSGLHKAVAVTKAAAKDAGSYIRQKLDETNRNSK